jgi:hypothetical protein
VTNDKLDHWMKSNHEKYIEAMQVMDMINEGEKLKEICGKFREIQRSTSHLKIVEETAKKYGKLIKTITQECDTEIAKYASEKRAFAVLAEDSDFLIFKGDWKYFSLHDLDIFRLTTKEFNKKALWNHLGLENFYQMAMLATMAGNDLMEFDEVKRFHSRLLRNLGWSYSVDNKFKAIADFVWNYLEGRNSRMIVDVMASEINWKEKERLKPLIRKSIEMYHTVRD